MGEGEALEHTLTLVFLLRGATSDKGVWPGEETIIGLWVSAGSFAFGVGRAGKIQLSGSDLGWGLLCGEAVDGCLVVGLARAQDGGGEGWFVGGVWIVLGLEADAIPSVVGFATFADHGAVEEVSGI